MILGITGGLGCGKSTAAQLFERRGFMRVDSDVMIRERVLTLPAVVEVLTQRYGSSVLGKEFKINRAAVAARVFADDAELRWLETLTHPVLFGLLRKTFAEAPAGRWAVEVPLLFEQAMENWFDFTVCVACSPEQQLIRLEQRGLSRALAGQRISKQLPLARKIELSDFILWNEGSADFLREEVDLITDLLPQTL